MRSKCSACGKILKVKTDFVGKKVRCPHCRESVEVAAVEDEWSTSLISPASAALSASSASSPPSGSTPLRKVKSSRVADALDFLSPPQGADELGRLGPYRILKVLGTGGMGIVFKAEEPSLNRFVALKALKPAFADDPSAAARFEREARSVGKVKHDNVVTIYHVGKEGKIPYLAMELLAGEPLEARLEREPKLPPMEVVRIGKEIARGLAAAHKLGLMHRDIKPGNIWLEAPESADDGDPASNGAPAVSRVKILDFGLARSADASEQLTANGVVVGTPEFMAPEQARGGAIDTRCDLFSLGILLYYMSTGELPFKRKNKNLMSVLMAIAKEEPTPPVFLNNDIPDEISGLIMHLLQKDADDRPASANAVVQRLAEIENPSLAAKAPPAKNAETATKKSPWLMIGIAVGALIVVGGIVAAVMLMRP
jgi:serine/threonine protein kinase/phage FluMu protein Com